VLPYYEQSIYALRNTTAHTPKHMNMRILRKQYTGHERCVSEGIAPLASSISARDQSLVSPQTDRAALRAAVPFHVLGFHPAHREFANNTSRAEHTCSASVRRCFKASHFSCSLSLSSRSWMFVSLSNALSVLLLLYPRPPTHPHTHTHMHPRMHIRSPE
jgi:hypothetical protein